MPGKAPLKWKAARLGGLCALNRERGADSGAYVGIEHIVPGRNRISGMGRASDYVTKRPFQAQNILYAKLGPEANKVWLATCGGQCSTDILPIRVTSNLVSPGFLAHVMAGSGFVRHAVSASSGTIMPRTPWRDIQRFLVPVPPMREQQKIASILSNVDALIENTEKYIAHYGKLKSSLMTRLLSPCVQTSNNTKVKRSICDMLRLDKHAGSWASVPLSQLCEVNGTVDASSTIYVGLEHIVSCKNYILAPGRVEDFKTHRPFQQNSILYGKLRPELNKVWLATCDGHCSVDILVLSPCTKTIVPAFLLYSLACSKFVKLAVSLSSGTKMPRTSWSNMKNIRFLVPPLETQHRIASILSGVDAVIENYRLYQQQLEMLKKGLMQKLLTGKIRV